MKSRNDKCENIKEIDILCVYQVKASMLLELRFEKWLLYNG